MTANIELVVDMDRRDYYLPMRCEIHSGKLEYGSKMSCIRKGSLHLKVYFINESTHEMWETHQFPIEETMKNILVYFCDFIPTTTFGKDNGVMM